MYKTGNEKNTLKNIIIVGLAITLLVGTVLVLQPGSHNMSSRNIASPPVSSASPKSTVPQGTTNPQNMPVSISSTSVPASASADANQSAVIKFQDKELERLIKSSLGIQNRDILQKDINDIEVIDVVGCFIQMKKTTGPYFGDNVYCHGGNYYIVNEVRHEDNDRGVLKTLADFKKFPHLAALMIEYQDNPDISAIPDIQSIYQLELFNDNIKDISELAGAKQLRLLNLAFNPITDYSPLAGLKIERMDEEYWTKDD